MHTYSIWSRNVKYKPSRVSSNNCDGGAKKKKSHSGLSIKHSTVCAVVCFCCWQLCCCERKERRCSSPSMPVLLYTVWKLTDGDNTASDSYYCHYRGYCYFCRAVWHSMKLVSLLAVSFWFATGQCTSTDQSQAELPALYLDIAIVVMLMQYWAVRQFWNGYHSGIAVRLCWLKNKKKTKTNKQFFLIYNYYKQRMPGYFFFYINLVHSFQ